MGKAIPVEDPAWGRPAASPRWWPYVLSGVAGGLVASLVWVAFLAGFMGRVAEPQIRVETVPAIAPDHVRTLTTTRLVSPVRVESNAGRTVSVVPGHVVVGKTGPSGKVVVATDADCESDAER
jgi:hypothetical protein